MLSPKNTKFAFPLQKALNNLAGTGGGGGDHGALTGLADDDHAQYHNDTRGDVRYYTKAQVDSSLGGKADTAHTQASSTITDFNSATRAQTEAELIAGSNITITPASSGATRTLTIASSGGATNLGYTASTRILTSDTGTDVTLPVVVAAGDSGLMTGADKTKLDGIASGAQVNVATDLAYTAATRLLASSTGADVNLPLVTSGDAGLAPASGGGTTNFLRADLTWAAPSGGGGTLDSLSDVIITAPSNTQVLKYNGSNWVNDTDSTGGGGGGSPILSWMI